MVLLFEGAGFDGAAWAQTPDVCSNTPGSNQRVACSERPDSSADISIDLRAVSIRTYLDSEYGISGVHEGSGDIRINSRDGSVTTSGERARGIHVWHNGTTGNTRITVQGGSITTAKQSSHGVYSLHSGAGNLDIQVEGGSVTTSGERAHGILGWHNGTTGNTRITVQGGSITTAKQSSHGVYSLHSGAGNLDIQVEGGSVTTSGERAHGILGWHNGTTGNTWITMKGGSITTVKQSSYGVYGWHVATGDLDVHVEGGSITTEGAEAYGILGGHNGTTGNTRITVQGGSITTAKQSSYGVHGWHGATGDLDVHVEGGSITTEGAEAHGILGRHNGTTGNTWITVKGGSITTEGAEAHGILGRHNDTTGNIWITVKGGSITTEGADAHGIYGLHKTGEGRISIGVGQGVSVHASGTDASGIRIGRFSTPTGALLSVAKMGADGYRRQTATVNGTVTGGSGAAAGVLLAGGGRVVVGPHGSVGAASGVAVHAARRLSTEDPPRLHVDFRIEGRHMSEALDGWIVNDGGPTTIVMNEVVLHDGARGATGLWAPNGALFWTIREQGVTIAGRPASGLDRDFSAADFISVYAPSAVLYESLPGLLLRLDEGPPRRRPETPAWTQVEHAVGHGGPARSRTEARYDYDRTEMLAGMSRAWGGGVSGSLWLRGVRVAAETEVFSGRGELDVRGMGAGLEARWRGEDGPELSGQLSLTDYDVDASSRQYGRLLREAGAQTLSARLMAGWRMELGPGARLLPRAWLQHAKAEVDDFTDTVGARASHTDESRTSGGLGLVAEWTGEGHTLYGSVDLERLLGGEATVVELSGQRFGASAERTRAWVGFGGESGGERLTLRGGIRLGDPGGRNEEFAASFSLAGRF